MKSVFSNPIYLSAPIRSPIGKFGGTLKSLSAPQLASLTLKKCIEVSGSIDKVGFVFMGHARQAGCGPNPARQAALGAGLPETIPAITINQACASGMAAIISACEKITLAKFQGKNLEIFAGGVESMSNTPYFLTQARWGTKMGNSQVIDGMHQDGFFCPMSQMVMGATVEKFLVPENQISRQEQDQFSLESQRKAARAWQSGIFSQEIFEIPASGKNPGLNHDEHRRDETTLESLKKLPPVFDPETGTITAGNSSGITDGAAFLKVGLNMDSTTRAEILDFESVALDPRRMGLGPVQAIQNILKRQNLDVSQIVAFELNEAFAAQVIACQRTLKIPEEKLNIRGGSIALGHPIGATGTRITVTLLNILKGQKGALGIASLCVSGGHGVAILVKSLD
jgi:acetyl-CoA C-acetyltransferase